MTKALITVRQGYFVSAIHDAALANRWISHLMAVSGPEDHCGKHLAGNHRAHSGGEDIDNRIVDIGSQDAGSKNRSHDSKRKNRGEVGSMAVRGIQDESRGLPPPQLEMIFENMDFNKDGHTPSQLELVFQNKDGNKDGHITTGDLKPASPPRSEVKQYNSSTGDDRYAFEQDLSRRLKVVEESLRLQASLGSVTYSRLRWPRSPTGCRPALERQFVTSMRSRP